MTSDYTGGCLCGDVRFSCSAQPEFTFYCHCRDCQRSGGAPFSVELMLPSASFRTEGDVHTFTSAADSGKEVHRHFCPRCGSGVYLECDSDPGYVFLKAGALDDPAPVQPDMHIFAAAQQPWVDVKDSLPRYEKMPPV